MRKALAQNPNMLRTMIGLGLTLILILSYAVYAATIDSSYYLYHTSNDTVDHSVVDQGLGDDNLTQTWTFSTTRATTWLNVSIENVEAGDILTVSVSSGTFYHHPMLGEEDADQFSCTQPKDDDDEAYNVCSKDDRHTFEISASGTATFRSIVDAELPLGGLGSLFADSQAEAEDKAEALIAPSNATKVWTITLTSQDEIHPDEFTPKVESALHELNLVEPCTVTPVTELLWSVAALIGCFGLALVIPLTAFIAGQAKEKRDERIRNAALVDADDSDDPGL